MKLCILMHAFGDGGVERMVVNTACGLAARGVGIEFLAGDKHGAYLDHLGPAAELTVLPAHRGECVKWLVAHLREQTPDVLLVAKAPDARLALRARSLARRAIPIVMRPGTTLTERVRGPAGRWKLWRLAQLYRRADAIVANSAGVREDVASVTGLAAERIHLIRNPVITPDLERLAAQPIEHPWFARREMPVIVGAGGLRRQKDFATLIRAFALLRKEHSARLVILGRGRQEQRLRELTAKLGVATDVQLAGFVDNPYPYLAHGDLFALSSRWEGSPNVLTEALALGTPVVATDCRSGPREILQGGRYGPLVPVGDPESMAGAMARMLDSPIDREQLRGAAAEYTLEQNAEHYHRILSGLVERHRD
jgi:glycosyltransferase involved in cell wall biosynthesis